ncbi:hypothetical protein GCM10010425_50460 [Streptomyces spororaveus]|uniref:Uncharacterized protein n=1 Tax=Streptomyces spororaveus TaxID=284039 RepID=A0ABQ3T3P9_9ACTN|nr:hypothetical protein Sspor_02010 [Streptomyces spororaveus]
MSDLWWGPDQHLYATISAWTCDKSQDTQDGKKRPHRPATLFRLDGDRWVSAGDQPATVVRPLDRDTRMVLVIPDCNGPVERADGITYCNTGSLYREAAGKRTKVADDVLSLSAPATASCPRTNQIRVQGRWPSSFSRTARRSRDGLAALRRVEARRAELRHYRPRWVFSFSAAQRRQTGRSLSARPQVPLPGHLVRAADLRRTATRLDPSDRAPAVDTGRGRASHSPGRPGPAWRESSAWRSAAARCCGLSKPCPTRKFPPRAWSGSMSTRPAKGVTTKLASFA